MKKRDFVTIYTDASFKKNDNWARIAFKAKCSAGFIESSIEIHSTDVHHAEMSAIKYAVEMCESVFGEEIEGFFVNSDNLGCVQAFWDFITIKKYKVPKAAKEVFEEVHKIRKEKWIRTKHVKAHTGRQDVRSYMNRTVDKMTRKPSMHKTLKKE